MRQKLILLCIFISSYCVSSQQFYIEDLQSQEQINTALDSAFVWTEKGRIKDFISNFGTIEKAIKFSKNDEFRARFNIYKAGFYCYLYDYDKLDFYLNKALEYYKINVDNEKLIYIYNLKGIYESYKNEDHYAAIKWFEKSISLVDFNDEKLVRVSLDVYFNDAVSNYHIKDWDAVYKASSKCIELVKRFKSESRLKRMYFYKGISLFHRNNIDEALENFKLSEAIVKKEEAATGKRVYFKEAKYLYGLSKVYRVFGDYKKSADYLEEYANRMTETVYPFVRHLGFNIVKNSNLLVGVERKEKEKAETELKKSELLYNKLLIVVGLLIIIGLLIFIFLQRKHQKLNIKRNELLTSKNKEVEGALRDKTEFLNSITHELRTPLYAINTIAHMMKKIDSDDLDSTQVDILSFSGDHLLRFVNDVIDSNMGAKKFKFKNLKLETFDLKKLLFKIKKTIRFSLQMDVVNNYFFEVDQIIPDALEVDTLKLSRIIINLLNNASKNTNGGNITLSANQLYLDAESCVVEFSVKDTGKGISKRQLDEIYYAFNNNLNLVKRIDERASGLGLGLVMVNRLLMLYKSELIIDSKEGVGTTVKFAIRFNISKNHLLKAKLNRTKDKNIGGHILIVDDNKINQMVTSKVVKEEGFTCDVVGGGYEAIEAFKRHNNYDFILMDIMMPEMDGFEAAKRIKAISSEQIIIALTAMSLSENKQKFVNSDFEKVIEKPFEISKFNSLIQSLMS